MTLRPDTRLVLLLFFSMQLASGLAKAAYWLPDVQALVPENVSIPRIQLDPAARQSPVLAWETHWTGQHASERWGGEASRLIVKYRVNPLRSVRMLASLYVAMHDAGLRASELGLSGPAQSAATHVSAARTLAHFFPLEPPERLHAMGESALAALAATQPHRVREIAQGASIGRGVARLAVLRALNDGADEVWDARTRPIEKPGMWRGVPPLDSAHPQEPVAGMWQTWMLKNGEEFRPPAPPAPDSDALLQAAQEVLEVSRNLTPEQKRIADYWHLDQGTVTPPGSWNLKAQELATRWKLPEEERLRLMSTLNAGMMDATIACWHAKYTWWLLRPATLIQARLDKTFMPYLVTPPHPSYTSGHATISGAAAEILKRFFPEDVREIDGWAEDAAMSRLYGGIHYRFDNEAGLALGRQVGKAALVRAPSQK